MRKTALLGLASLLIGLAAALPARADEEPVHVTIELRGGGRVQGELVDYADGVYRVRQDGRVERVSEADIARVRFGAPEPTSPPAEAAPRPAPAEEAAPEEAPPDGLRPGDPSDPIHVAEPHPDVSAALAHAAEMIDRRVSGRLVAPSLRTALRRLDALAGGLSFMVDASVPDEPVAVDLTFERTPLPEAVNRVAGAGGAAATYAGFAFLVHAPGRPPFLGLTPHDGSPAWAEAYLTVDLDDVAFARAVEHLGRALDATVVSSAAGRERAARAGPVQIVLRRAPAGVAVELLAHAAGLRWTVTSSGSVILEPRVDWDVVLPEVRVELPRLDPRQVARLDLEHDGLRMLPGGRAYLVARDTTLRSVRTAVLDVAELRCEADPTGDLLRFRDRSGPPAAAAEDAPPAEADAAPGEPRERGREGGYDLRAAFPEVRRGSRLEVRLEQEGWVSMSGRELDMKLDAAWRDDIGALDAGGRRIARLTRTYGAFAKVAAPGLDPSRRPIEVSRGADGSPSYAYADGGSLEEALRKQLDEEFKNSRAAWLDPPLPDRPVRVGETWSVDMERYLAYADGQGYEVDRASSAGTGRLTEVRDDVAVVEIDLSYRCVRLEGLRCDIQCADRVRIEVPLKGRGPVTYATTSTISGSTLGLPVRGSVETREELTVRR